jgi:hypothetical protein
MGVPDRRPSPGRQDEPLSAIVRDPHPESSKNVVGGFGAGVGRGVGLAGGAGVAGGVGGGSETGWLGGSGRGIGAAGTAAESDSGAGRSICLGRGSGGTGLARGAAATRTTGSAPSGGSPSAGSLGARSSTTGFRSPMTAATGSIPTGFARPPSGSLLVRRSPTDATSTSAHAPAPTRRGVLINRPSCDSTRHGNGLALRSLRTTSV